MHVEFKQVIEALHPSFERLMAMRPVKHACLPRDMPEQGVYLFSEGDQHMYVGRSNRMRNRFGQHCRPGSQHNQAVFAFKLAREETGQTVPAYASGQGSRKALSLEPRFEAAFSRAKERVRSMDYRYVEETDQRKQALLELYCAIALGCHYNDFKTH